MIRMKDLTGQIFGRLVILGFSYRDRKNYYWLCKCECGVEKIIKSYSFTSGHTKSCGCWHTEAIGLRQRTHSKSHTGIYHSWHCMIQRCTLSQNPGYQNYGGRGIKVCKRWLSFEVFYSDMNSSWFTKATLERKNVNGHYTPSNCLWITKAEQQKNKRNSVIIDTPWGRLTSTDAAKIIGINQGSMASRIHKWPKSRWFEPPWTTKRN